jgi:hypothetical protein
VTEPTPPLARDEVARCRGCNRELLGSPYWKGGFAYDPKTMEQVKMCYYGGWACSYDCDYRACLELERTMPGHPYNQTSLGSLGLNLARKWDVK